MKVDLRRWLAATILSGCAIAPSFTWANDEAPWFSVPVPPEEALEPLPHEQFRFANFQPSQPIESPLTGAPSQPLESGLVEEGEVRFLSLRDIQDELTPVNAPGVTGVNQAEVKVTQPTDLGKLIKESESVQTVNAQRRSPIAFDPRIRGYHFGQIYAQSDGEYYLPVRMDLDSMVNKIDPSLIDTITVIPGPYGLRFGPGFSFLDVVTFDTPRTDCGFEGHNRFAAGAYSNGGQVYGRDTYLGAGENYGFVLHYGIRTGADYRAGNGQKIPSSYHSQSVLAQVGWDLSECSKVEFRYNRLDMWDTEYAFQFFDIDALETDSFNLIYKCDDWGACCTSLAQVWYNTTTFDGDNLNSGKAEVRRRVTEELNRNTDTGGQNDPSAIARDGFRARVSGDLSSLGGRYVRTYGEETSYLTRYGVDFRYVTQNTLEQYSFTTNSGVPSPFIPSFDTEQPDSSMTDPGMFMEISLPWLPYLRTTWGGRLDWVNTHATNYVPSVVIPGITDQEASESDVLFASYLSGDLELDEVWTIRAAGGYAERVPNLVDRYGAGVFVGMIQNGFTRIIGSPSLKKEGALQLDTSLRADYGWFFGSATYFHSWINDYNTYASFDADPTGAQVLVAQNTSLATLNGFELYFEYEMNEMTTPFFSVTYVEGYDHEIDRPLPGIYPLESRVGLRWADPSVDNIWGLEWGFRFVARQNRVGMLRDNIVGDPGLRRVEAPTPGFMTSYLQGYYNVSERLHLIGGIDNLFDRNYIEHLDLRLPPDAAAIGPVAAFAPGFTAYAGLEYEL